MYKSPLSTNADICQVVAELFHWMKDITNFKNVSISQGDKNNWACYFLYTSSSQHNPTAESDEVKNPFNNYNPTSKCAVRVGEKLASFSKLKHVTKWREGDWKHQ